MRGGDVNLLRFGANPGGSENDPRTHKPLRAKPLDGEPLDIPPHEDPRDHLVDWMPAG